MPASHISSKIDSSVHKLQFMINRQRKEKKKFVERHHHSHKQYIFDMRENEKNLNIRWRGFQVSKDNRIKMKWKQLKRSEQHGAAHLKNWTAEKRETSIFWLQYVILKRCNKMWPLLTFRSFSHTTLVSSTHFMWLLATIRAMSNGKKKKRNLLKLQSNQFWFVRESSCDVRWMMCTLLGRRCRRRRHHHRRFYCSSVWECQKATLYCSWHLVWVCAIGRFTSRDSHNVFCTTSSV